MIIHLGLYFSAPRRPCGHAATCFPCLPRSSAGEGACPLCLATIDSAERLGPESAPPPLDLPHLEFSSNSSSAISSSASLARSSSSPEEAAADRHVAAARTLAVV
eukprot:tig00000113_g5637.t1